MSLSYETAKGQRLRVVTASGRVYELVRDDDGGDLCNNKCDLCDHCGGCYLSSELGDLLVSCGDECYFREVSRD